MEHTSATIRPAIWRTMRSSLDWPSDGSAMLSRRRRRMIRSAGSEGVILGVSPLSCIAECRRFRRSIRAATGRAPAQRAAMAGASLAPPVMKSVFVQLVQAVQGAHRQLGVGRIYEHADLDLGRGDGEDVDAPLGQR